MQLANVKDSVNATIKHLIRNMESFKQMILLIGRHKYESMLTKHQRVQKQPLVFKRMPMQYVSR